MADLKAFAGQSVNLTIKEVNELAERWNAQQRRSLSQEIFTEAQVASEMAGWAPAIRGIWADDPDFERASELAGALYAACLAAGLEDFEAVRSGLAEAYEGIVRPQGRSFQKAWKEILAVWSGKTEGAIPRLEKAVARLLIKEARKARLESEGSALAHVVVRKGDYIAQYVGGKWRVGLK